MGSFLSSLFHATCADDETSAVIQIHDMSSWDEHWNANKDSDKLVLIDFYAEWCAPCRFIGPAFKALAAKHTEISFVQIDVDDVPGLAQQWKIQSMPTFVLLRGWKEKGRIVGAKKSELEMMIQRHGTN